MYEWSLIMPLISNKQKAFEGDVVQLSADIPSFNVERGQRGIIITAFDEPEAYDLEMENESGDFIGFAYSIKPDQFTNLSRNAFVRAMEAVEKADLVTAETELRAATDLRPDYIGSFVMSVLATVPEGVEEKGLEDDVSYLIPLLRLATRVDPDYEFARVNLAVAFLNFGVGRARKKKYFEAIELFYSALGIRTDPETESRIRTNIVRAFTTLARESFQSNRVEDGFRYVRTAFLVLQDEITARNLGLAYGNLGVFHMRSRRFEFALEQFERAEDSGVVLPEYLNDRGVCLVFLGRINEAIQVFERVLGMNPENEVAQFNLAKLKQVSTREISAQDLDTFADQFFIPAEDLADLIGRAPNQLTWRKPALSTQEFAFAFMPPPRRSPPSYAVQ
jgi:tetratricopeptide (TPR) repeat protein